MNLYQVERLIVEVAKESFGRNIAQLLFFMGQAWETTNKLNLFSDPISDQKCVFFHLVFKQSLQNS